MTNTNYPTGKPAPRPAASTTPASPFHYFVSVISVTGRGVRVTQFELSLSRLIEDMQAIQDLQNWIRTKHGIVDPQIMGFTLLRNDLTSHQGGQA